MNYSMNKTILHRRHPTFNRGLARQSGRTLLPAIIGIVLIGGALIWGFTQDEPVVSEPAEVSVAEPITATDITPAAPAEPEDTAAEASVPMTPAIPPTEGPVEEEADSGPLPPEAAEVAIKEAYAALSAPPAVDQFMASDFAIDRGVAVIDNLRIGNVPYKLIPIGRPKAAFPIEESNGVTTMDPEGFSRYQNLAGLIENIDTEAFVDLYRQFEAEIGQAYGLLGYQPEDLENSILYALELIISAPAARPNAELVKREAVYVYVDETLENLPPLQKQIMRMGDDNAEVIKQKAEAFREALSTP
ncbi:DUF3014 domain-containing protein [Luminiphilus syltensis]|nr:DUF3014 domain-containing protein [Luminiphilus syltensis]